MEKLFIWKLAQLKCQNNYDFLKLLYICQHTSKIVPPKIIAVSGLSQRKLNEPSLISNDLLKFSSISPPNTKARIRGGIGKL